MAKLRFNISISARRLRRRPGPEPPTTRSARAARTSTSGPSRRASGGRPTAWRARRRTASTTSASASGTTGFGATIMGRNMFGPVRGAWGDEQWNGWWGDDPPFHHPVFVLTHHARDPLTWRAARRSTSSPAASRPRWSRRGRRRRRRRPRLGGGASTVQQYLRAGLIDELRGARRRRSCSAPASACSRPRRRAEGLRVRGARVLAARGALPLRAAVAGPQPISLT